ncbi:MAG: N-acetyltransferase [Acidimicrobiales bacterium]
MQSPPGSPDWLGAFTAAERPDLWALARSEQAFDGLWPEYNKHGNQTNRYFGALFPRFAHLQVLFVDKRCDRLVARARTIPMRWDGTLSDLPRGIDATGNRALDEPGEPTALSALAAEVERDFQGRHLSALVLRAMAAVARENLLAPLLAPVRPSWKDRYPLVPIGRYAAWCRRDGLPFDPWMRVHARLGARTVRSEPRSLQISAGVEDWQAWTGMSFREQGRYIFPGGLAPLEVSGGRGDYFEPNVWMLHEI